MKFEKEVLFLGISANELSDGGVYYTVQFFDADGGEPVSVNVGNGERTAGLVSELRMLTFGDRLRAVFVLRTQGAKLDNGSVKQYLKLSLSDVTVC